MSRSSRFVPLTRLFLRDLVRRRMLWLLAIATLGMVLVNYGVLRIIDEGVGRGETWDVATRRAASQLDAHAEVLREWLRIGIVLLAAQVAPESRRNGTTQFVLSIGVRRSTLAASQFAALALVVTAGALVVHAGFAVAGLRTGGMTRGDVGLAWAGLVVPLLALAAGAFALSLTASALETERVFIGVPFLTRTLPALANGHPKASPRALVRLIDNLSLFFPDIGEIVPWPHLGYGVSQGPPYPEWGWSVVHLVAASSFWIVLGVWLHRRHDFGSRTALK